MAFENFRRERQIRRVMRALARQRVAVILQPGNVWVVENAPSNLPFQEEAFRTCLLRGWVAVLHEAVPKGSLTPEGNLPNGSMFQSTAPIYRLTEAGWLAINRAQAWVIATFAVAFATLAATAVMLWRG
jgi:hypothetical protein